ncbi:glycoside hydrolase family 88 protein [Solihabitans fulvus]|uniref:Glycoside hydrolase family 88 protein n=1 Tax=Solihabitans fulvus TaxID=1892852 RepID=A0A5B2WMI3_9PSEU|nr:glycoside hydrolase family 88 protein [Solihabitans fulvus]KAA2252981.1 glycoside hydrolase family 88 protein [Solihabitans fulvus]
MTSLRSRRDFFRLTGTVAGGLALGAGALAAAAPAAAATPLLAPNSAAPADWSVAVVESTLKRFPTPASIGGWGYAVGLYLYGQYLVYRRTGTARYLGYVKDWVDRFVGADGSISNSFNSLDSMRCGTLLVILHAETGQDRYRIAAKQIRDRLNTYPRNADGAFWHATSRQHQLWADGTYMALPFLAGYGKEFGDAAYANTEVVKQLQLYTAHLASQNGLLYHAYDESGKQTWADPKTHRSPEFWLRAVGWYGMTCVDVLDILPADHPDRPKIIAMVGNLVRGIARYQDPRTGRWFQVVDKGSNPQNWTETSGSSMFSYVVSRAVQRGYVTQDNAAVAARGYRGVLSTVSVGSDGLTTISDICTGTNVGELSYYLSRPRAANDFHGLGSFLIMNEQFAGHPTGALLEAG